MYKKILLINPFGIGDVLFTTPVIHTLKDVFKDVKIGYLCNSRTAPILKDNPYLDYIFIYDRDEFDAVKNKSFFAWLKKELNFLNQIKKVRFDAAFDFSLNAQYGFFSWYAGITQRFGYDFKNRGRFLTKKAALSGYHEKHIVEYYGELLKYLGIKLKYNNLELYLNDEAKKNIEEILERENISSSDILVGIIPGAGRSWGKDAHLKHWPPEKFAQLADKIIENYPVKIIIMGDFFEQEPVKKLIAGMRNKAIDFSGKTTISQLAALLAKMKLVVTNDGGPLHMSAALGVKTVSIFGPVDERVYGPYPAGGQHITIKEDLSCRPCYQNFRMPECNYNRRCIESIKVDKAFDAVRSLL